MAWRRSFCGEVLPFSAMVMVECIYVGLNTLFKAATLKGMNYHPFLVYTYAIATVVLLPFAFFSYRRTELPPFKVSILGKICLLGLIGFLAQWCGYKGLEYSSPTLSSAIGNLTPAIIFILAVFFRLEKIYFRSLSSQAKIIGTLISISGAFVVVLYKGPAIVITQTPSFNGFSLQHLSASQYWVISGHFFTGESILLSLWYIVQAQIMEVYPAELVVVFLFNVCATIISTPVCIVSDRNLNDWKLTTGIALVAIAYSGLVGSSLGTSVYTWGVRTKGPVYVALFKPLSIVIAAFTGVIFLGENLYLGTVVGGVIISFGFYIAMWAKANEERVEDSTQRVPLLQNEKSNQKELA